MCLDTVSTVLLTLTLSICFVEISSIKRSFTIYDDSETCTRQCKKGICVKSPEDKNNEWYCNCVDGYYGTDCKEHPCDQMPCKNGGKCVAESVDGRYFAEETSMRMKKMPSLVYQMIASQYKPNTVLGYKCICDEKYVGEHCEVRAACADQYNGNEDPDLDVVTCSGVGKCIQDGENVQCQCEAGHIGERCRSYAACTPSPCYFGFACLPLYGDVSKFTTNYTCACKGNKNCVEYDINECALKNDCHMHANCSNNVGSYSCNCNEGFEGDGKTCVDIDECEMSICSKNARCENILGSFSCECNNGYQGDGRSCEEINECESDDLNNCHEKATCINTIGSYECLCKDGYEGDGRSCKDVNECKSDNLNNCHKNATCVNAMGSYECLCKDGYKGDGRSCRDINECESDKLNNCHEKATCVNAIGSFECLCIEGYEGDGRSCEDVNECDSVSLNNCHKEAACVNKIGSFECICKDGYKGNGISCEDANECESDNLNNCQEKANCVNTIGSYECVCKDGYCDNGIGYTGIDAPTEKLDDSNKRNGKFVNTEVLHKGQSQKKRKLYDSIDVVDSGGDNEFDGNADGDSNRDADGDRAGNDGAFIVGENGNPRLPDGKNIFTSLLYENGDGDGNRNVDVDRAGNDGAFNVKDDGNQDDNFYIQYKAQSDVRDTPYIRNVSNNNSPGMTICTFYKFSKFPNGRPRSLFHYIIDQKLNGFQVIFHSRPQKIHVKIIGQSFDVPYPTNDNKRWTHLCVVYDRGNVAIWKNGFLIKKHTMVALRGVNFPASNLGVLVLGQDSYDIGLLHGIVDSSRAFQGSITQFYVWEKALNKIEIRNAYRRIPTTEKTVLKWIQWRSTTHGRTIRARYFSKKGTQ